MNFGLGRSHSSFGLDAAKPLTVHWPLNITYLMGSLSSVYILLHAHVQLVLLIRSMYAFDIR